jgi:hypothetical protein
MPIFEDRAQWRRPRQLVLASARRSSREKIGNLVISPVPIIILTGSAGTCIRQRAYVLFHQHSDTPPIWCWITPHRISRGCSQPFVSWS